MFSREMFWILTPKVPFLGFLTDSRKTVETGVDPRLDFNYKPVLFLACKKVGAAQKGIVFHDNVDNGFGSILDFTPCV